MVRRKTRKVLMILFSLTLFTLTFLHPQHYRAAAAEGNPSPPAGLMNVGFEQAVKDGVIPGWQQIIGIGGNGAVTVDSTQKRSGSNSLKLSDQDSVVFAMESVKIPAVEGETYRAAASWYLESGSAQLQIRYYNAAGALLKTVASDYVSSPLKLWQPIILDGTAPAQTTAMSVVLATGKNSKGIMYVDDISLSQQIALSNAGFEEVNGGTVNNWSMLLGADRNGDITRDTTTVRTGMGSMKLSDRDNVNFAAESAKITVAPGDMYTVTSAVYIASGSVQLQMRFYNAQNQLVPSGAIAVNDPNYTSSPLNQWQLLSLSTPVPLEAVSASIVVVSVKTAHSTSYWDDVHIFKLVPPTPDPTPPDDEGEAPGNDPDQTTIVNAGFDMPLTAEGQIPGWSQAFGTEPIGLDSSIKHEGDSSLKLSDSSNTETLGLISSSISVTPGYKYTVSAMVYGTGAGSAELYLRYFDSAGNMLTNVNSVLAKPQQTWTSLQVSQLAPPTAVTAKVLIYSAKAAVSTIYYDSLTWLEEIPAPPAQRILLNGGFEQPIAGDKIIGWTIKTGLPTITTAEKKMGSQSLRISYELNSGGSAFNMETALMDVEEHTTYTISADVLLELGTMEGLYVYVYDVNGAIVKSADNKDFHAYLNATANPGSWQYRDTSFTVQPGGVKLKVALITGSKKSYTFYLDELSVMKHVPNGSLEQPVVGGVIPGWKKFAPTDAPSFEVTSERANSGSSSLLFSNTPGMFLNVISELVPVEAGATYTAMARSYIDNGSSGMYVRYFDAERNYISKQAWSIVAEPVSVWFDQYVTAVVPEGAHFAAIMFAGGNSKPYRYYVDDVKLLRGEHALPDVPLPDNSIVKVGQDLGPQIRKATLMRNAVGKDGQGRDVIYSVVAGSPSIFTMIDIETEKVTRSIPMPDTDGAWSVTVSSDGSVYLGAYNLGLLYRYLPATDELINLGHPFSTKDSVLYPMAAGKDGKMYGSTYPTAHLYEYNPATNQFKDFGTMSHRTSGERWTRVVTYDEATHKIYAGVGNVPRLLEYDLATGAKRELLPAGFDNIISVYDLNLAGGKLFARKEANNANETFVVDIKSGNMLEVTNGVTGEKTNAFTNLSRGVSPKSPIANKVYYAAAGGDLYEYDLDTDTYRPLGASIEGAAIGYDFVQLNEEGFPGYSLVGISGNSGKMYKYNLETGKVKLTDIQVPAEPVNIHDIAKGPDGKIYTAGYLQGNLGVHTPSTGESMYFEGISQGEGMTKIRNKMYLGIYPGAKIYEYDLSKPWNRTNSDQLNPNTLFSLSASNPPPNSYLYQDRPFGMGSAEELNKLFVGTVPKNAMLGGVLAVYDVETRGEPEVYWNIVPDQSILSFAYKNGFLYAGTSIHGGQGSTPTAKEAVLFIWDVVNKRKVFELVPVAGKQAITALHVGPDGNIWGLANGTLFILDIETRQIIHSNNAFPAASGRWIDGSMETGTDGNVYATVGGSFFKVDAATKEVTVLATQVGKLAQDDFGSFYMFNDPPGPNLYKYSTPELQLKLTGAELSAPATVLSVGGQTELKLKGLLERGRSTYELSGAVKTYTLSQPHIAQIDNGRLTALKPGNTDLTVTLMLDGVTVVSNTINLTIQEVPDTVTDTGTDTNTDNNTGGGTNIGSTPGSSSPTPPVEVGTDGSLTVGNQQVAIENGQAVVRISSSVLTNALQQLTEQTDQPGKALIIRVPEMTADQPLLVEFPAGALSSQTVEAIREIRVAAGKVELSLPMEQLLGAGQDEILAFRIAVVDPKQLPKQAAEQIGTNPVYEMDILADGRKKETHSEEATITITLPYTLQSVDAAERLVAFYVSEDGKLEPMRLSVYNEKNGTLTFRTNHLSMYTVNPINVSIDDVASNRWSAAFIDTVVARGLMSTTTNHMFQPETAATRAEFVHSVMKAFGWRGEQAEHPFTDVSTSDPVGASIAAAFNRGIIHGMSETHFGSDLTLSRQDMAVILQRALQAAAIPMSGSSIAPSFEDQEQIAAYALASIKKLRQAEIVSGDEHNMFLPEQPVTREQVAKLITELLERL